MGQPPNNTILSPPDLDLLTLKEVVARIRTGRPIIWLTMTDATGTYDVAIDGSARADWSKR